MDKWVDTTAYAKIKALSQRIGIIQGGTSAGKTVAMVAMLADISFDLDRKIISVVTDTLPNLRRGAMRDFERFISLQRWGRYFEQNKTTNTWRNIITGTIIEFFSIDTMGALGARRDYLFVNEANRINFDTFGQLEVRTNERVWLDFNPVNEFWAHTELMKRNDYEFLKLTYKDNEALNDNIVKSIEQRRGDGTSNWWRVYGLGEVGSLEGNVYANWIPVDKPNSCILLGYGLDWGFADDPTAMVAIYKCEDGGLWLQQVIYEAGILPSAYPDKLRKHGVDPTKLIVADNARPELIAECKNAGFRCIACVKGQGSIKRGIDRVKEQKISYDPNSKDLEREFLTYAWKKRKGEATDEPEDANNHALDGLRYFIDDMYKPKFDF